MDTLLELSGVKADLHEARNELAASRSSLEMQEMPGDHLEIPDPQQTPEDPRGSTRHPG